MRAGHSFWTRTAPAVALLACLLVATLATAHPGHGAGGGTAEDPGADMPGVLKLTDATFDDVVGKGKAALVEFYAPWCGHCRHMAPAYAKLGAALDASPQAQERLVVAKVDGQENRALMNRFAVRGFPTILYFPAGSLEGEKYMMARSADDLVAFIRQKDADLDLFIPKEPQYIVQLNADEYDKKVGENQRVNAMVFFYGSGCGPCEELKPILNEVARIYQRDERVLIAQVDGDQPENRELVQRLRVDSIPSILFYEFGGRAAPPERYWGSNSVEGLVEFINERAYTHRLPNGDLGPDDGLIDPLTTALHEMIENVKDEAKLAEGYKKFLAYGKGLRGDNVVYYLRLAKRTAEDKSTAFVESEKARLTRILGEGGSGAAAGARRDNMMRRRNILEAALTDRRATPTDIRKSMRRNQATKKRMEENDAADL